MTNMLAGQAISIAVESPENRALLLEHIVDRDGVLATLETLASIARDKAQHISENWQDSETARIWERIGNRIESLRESESLVNLCRAVGERVAS